LCDNKPIKGISLNILNVHSVIFHKLNGSEHNNRLLSTIAHRWSIEAACSMRTQSNNSKDSVTGEWTLININKKYCRLCCRCDAQIPACLTLYRHIKTAEQRTIQQYDDWYTGRWWVGCYIWHSEEGPWRAAAPPRPLLAVPNVTAHPLTASVPTSYRSMRHYSCPCTIRG